MPNAGQIRYLHDAGVEFLSAESPALWTHLESRFSDSKNIGSKFAALSATFVAALIADGEAALLDQMTGMLRDTGRIGRVTRVLKMPYLIGTEAVCAADSVDATKIITLIQSPGEVGEHHIRVIMADADDIPCTSTVTVEGGLYPDGRTAGFFALYPGDLPAHGRGDDKNHVFLATEEEIRRLTAEMLSRADDLTTATKAECAAMVERALKVLG